MERIELFDNYINNQLSDVQRSEFDARLESDKEFASDFKVYLLTVNGICQEAQQDNLDFGKAMKGLSKEQLQQIVGQRKNLQSNQSPKETSVKVLRFKSWIWQVASIAAIIVIAFTVVFNIEKNARFSVDNAIYACAEINSDLTRDGSEMLDIRSMSDDELKENLHKLVSNYNTAETSDEVADNGFALAMAYLRLHDREKAKEVLCQLISKFKDNPEYAGYVNQWQSISTILK